MLGCICKTTEAQGLFGTAFQTVFSQFSNVYNSGLDGFYKLFKAEVYQKQFEVISKEFAANLDSANVSLLLCISISTF